MKILLINPPGWQKESINLGLAYLSAALKKAGYSTLILDLNRYEMSDWTLVQRAKDFAPSIIGISVKTATAREGGRIANILSAKLGETIFIVGGPHITICAESYMREFPVFHYAIMGEGEQSIVELAEAIINNKPVLAINGLVFREDGQIIINNWCPPNDLDDLPLPDLDAIEGFNWHGFRYPIVTSRGCPFQCTYCCVNKLTGSRKWRSRSAKNVVDEIEYIARTKRIKSFEVWDDNFTLNIKRAKEICQELIDRKINLSWYCHNGIRADRIDLELATLMKRAGCESIAFGIESGNPETFDSIKKGEPLSAVVNAVKLIKKVGIKAVGYFIIGLPGDTLDKFVETVRFQHSLKLDNYVYGMLVPYPKTEVWDIVQSRGTMFCDITHTQHFSTDIVPISFELPEFQKQDMIRAFYIAKYFALYESVQQTISKGVIPVVVYLSTPQITEYLPGLLIACHRDTKHIIVGQTDKDTILEHPSFLQLPEGINIVVCETLPDDLSKGNLILVCHKDCITKNIVFSNTKLFLFEPSTPLIVNARNYIRSRFPLPESVLSMIGFLSALPDIKAQFGIKKILDGCSLQLKSIIQSRFPRLVSRMAPFLISTNVGNRGLIYKIGYRFYELLQLTVSMPWHIYQYSRTKRKLRMIKSEKKGDFPYDDYSSYM